MHEPKPTTGRDFFSKACQIAPLLAERSAENEAGGRLCDATIRLLREGGFFGLSVPRCWGGAEADALSQMAIFEEISRADAATGWVLMACAVAGGTAGAYLPRSAAAQMFANGIAIAAGEGAPKGRAEVVPGGYRLSGDWSYGSGVLHADYIHTGAMVFENGVQRHLPGTHVPEVRTFIVPVEKAQLKGNWDVLGLRATGSIDYAMSDVFVPQEFTHLAAETVPQQGGDFYRLGVHGMSVLGHSAFTLGVGRRVLDELTRYARAGRGRPGAIGDSESFQEDFAMAEARLLASRAFIYDIWQDVSASLGEGPPRQRQFTLMRMGLLNVTDVVVGVATFAHRSAGGAALRAGALQRCLRDVFTATQHRIVTRPYARDCGQELLGTDKRWTIRGLMDH